MNAPRIEVPSLFLTYQVHNRSNPSKRVKRYVLFTRDINVNNAILDDGFELFARESIVSLRKWLQ